MQYAGMVQRSDIFDGISISVATHSIDTPLAWCRNDVDR